MPLIIVKQAGGRSLPEVTGSHWQKGVEGEREAQCWAQSEPEDLSYDCRKGPGLSHNHT